MSCSLLRQIQRIGKLVSEKFNLENQNSLNSEAEFLQTVRPETWPTCKRSVASEQSSEGNIKSQTAKQELQVTALPARASFLSLSCNMADPLLSPRQPATILRKGKSRAVELKINTCFSIEPKKEKEEEKRGTDRFRKSSFWSLNLKTRFK
jgi:hypothetical protein